MTNEWTYVFLDESGDFDFSPNGSRYFLMTSVIARWPFPWEASLSEHRRLCLESGMDIQHFHCYDDTPSVRHNVFRLIQGCLQSFEIVSLVVDKAKTNPVLRPPERFYPRMLRYQVEYILKRRVHERFVIITDRVPQTRRRKAIEKAVKTTAADVLPKRVGTERSYRILHHESKAHFGLQVADYCSWAIQRKWQKKNYTYYNMIRPALTNEFDVFERGTDRYY